MLIDANGAHLRELATVAAPNYLDWSPDGASLVYSAAREIYRLGLANPTPVQLTHEDPATNDESWQPSWSPDGRLIVFDRLERCFRCTGVWVMNADGSNQREVVQDGRRPVFSPDGTKIAISLSESDRLVVDLNGNAVARGSGAYAVWSPKGRYVAWAGGSLHTYNLATHRQRLVTKLITQKPAWSPNGTYIAGGGRGGVVAVVRAADGSHYTKLPASTILAGVPTWAPNGTVAYVHSGSCGIDLAHPDGTHFRRLTRAC
jgi:Tol biopolymer transport system component